MAAPIDLENWQAQVDEIQALEAIFEADFQITSVTGLASSATPPQSSWDAATLASEEPPSGPWTLSCQLAVRVNPPDSGVWEVGVSDPLPSTLRKSEDLGDRISVPRSTHCLLHLPPVMLSLVFPPSYPSESAPEMKVSSIWLSRRQVVEIEAELSSLWEGQGVGLPVCWLWTDWIENSLMGHLLESQNSSISSSKCFLLESDPLEESSSEGEGDEGERKESSVEGDRDEPVENRLMALLRHSAAREMQLFRQGMHTCGVCLEEQRGDRFVRLDCGHVFCGDCLGEQARLHVKEGSLDALKCPEPGCKDPLSVHVLRRLLEPEAFDRWEQLMLQRALDSMPDAAYCPRCSTLSLEDAQDNCAECSKCFFVFCTLCNEGRHPGVQCVSAETRLAMLRRKAEGGGAAAVAELRRKEHEIMSLAEIEKTSKPCPACGMAIQRSEGCNKMVCGNCNAFFCYKCGKQISGYDHFKAGGDCVLFDEAEILRWERRWEEQAGAHAAAAFRNDYLLDFGDAYEGAGGGGNGGIDAGNNRGGGGNRGGQVNIVNCPCCGQPNYRFARNNHLQCWSCTRHFCALCRAVLPRRGGGTHFGPRGCSQHS